MPGGVGVQLTVEEHVVRRDDAGRLTVDRDSVSREAIGRAFQPWHTDVESEASHRWRGYLDPVYNLTLLNLIGAITPYELVAEETPFVDGRAIELARMPVAQTFDLDHLKAIHARLFQDVYPWAGETRTIDMHRPGAPAFRAWQEVPASIANVAEWIHDQGDLSTLTQSAFAEGAAVVYHEINMDPLVMISSMDPAVAASSPAGSDRNYTLVCEEPPK